MATPVLSMAVLWENAQEVIKDPMILESAMTVGPVAVLVSTYYQGIKVVEYDGEYGEEGGCMKCPVSLLSTKNRE